MARNFDLSVRLRAAVDGLKDVQALISEIEDLGGATQDTASQSAALAEELNKATRSQELIDSFKRLRTEVDATGDELQEAQAEAQRLGKELNTTSTPTKKLERDFDKARAAVARLKNEQQEQVVALQNNRRELSRAGVDSRNLSQAQVQIRQSMARTTDEIEDLTASLKQVRDQSRKELDDPTDRLEKGAKGAGDAVDSLGTRLRRLATVAVTSVTAFFGIREAIRGITGIVRVGGEFEILQKRLESLTGSAEAGEEAFQWIRQFTKDTPFQLEQVTDAFVRAKAFGLDPMNGTLQAVADQAAKTGGGMEALNGIVTALGQAYSKGKIQAEEMLQLVERGVPAWDLLAEATGKTVGQLQEMTTAGELGRKEIELLIQQLGKAGAGAAQSQMEALQGLVSNLQDTFKEFLRDINDAGLLDYVKGQIQDLATAFREMRESGELQEWAKRISDSIIGMVESLKTIGSTLYEYRDAIAAVAKGWIAYKAAQAAVDFVRFGRTIRNGAILAMDGLASSTGKATGRVGKLRAGLRALPGPAKVAALAAAFLGLDKVLVSAGESLGEFLAKQSDAAKSLEQLQQRIQDNARARLQDLDAELEKLEQYRSVRQVTAEEAAKLSDEERKALIEQLRGQEELLKVERIRALQFETLGHNVKQSNDEITEGFKATRASLDALGAATQKTADAMANGVSVEAQNLIDQFDQLTSTGTSAADAIKGIFEGLESGNVTSVRTIVEAIGQISEQSAEAGEAIEKELADRLDKMAGEELKRFSITLKAAFDGGTEAARRFADMADEVADAALRKIGTSLDEIRTGISDMEREALDAFDAFTASGKRSADEVLTAMEHLKDDIKSPEAVDELRAMMTAWAQQSGQSVKEVEEAVEALAVDVKGTAEQIKKELGDAISSAGDEEALAKVREDIRTLWDEGKVGATLYSELLSEVTIKQAELAAAARETAQAAGDGMSEAADAAKGLSDASAGAQKDLETTRHAAQSMAGAIANTYNSAADRLRGLSQAAHDAFVGAMNGGQVKQAGNAMQSRIRQLGNQLNELRGSVGSTFGGLARWFRDTAIASKDVERQYLMQKQRLEQLNQALQDGINVTGRYSSDMDSLRRSFSLLDETDLSGLSSALQAAESRADSLAQSMQSTVSTLRQEIAGLRGQSIEVEKIRQQQELLQLEEEARKAREEGDGRALAAANEALRLQKVAHRLRLQQLQEEEAAKKQADQGQSLEDRQKREQELGIAGPQQAAPQTQNQQQTNQPTQRVELVLNGQTTSFSGSPDDVNKLMEFLNQAGMSSTQ